MNNVSIVDATVAHVGHEHLTFHLTISTLFSEFQPYSRNFYFLFLKMFDYPFFSSNFYILYRKFYCLSKKGYSLFEMCLFVSTYFYLFLEVSIQYFLLSSVIMFQLFYQNYNLTPKFLILISKLKFSFQSFTLTQCFISLLFLSKSNWDNFQEHEKVNILQYTLTVSSQISILFFLATSPSLSRIYDLFKIVYFLTLNLVVCLNLTWNFTFYI